MTPILHILWLLFFLFSLLFVEQYEKLQKESRQSQINYFQVRQQLEELQEKMKFFTKESAVDFQELEEALIIVKVWNEKATSVFGTFAFIWHTECFFVFCFLFFTGQRICFK